MPNNNKSTAKSESNNKSNNLKLNNLRQQMKSQLGSPVFAIKQLYQIAEAEVCGDIRKILPHCGKNKAVTEHCEALSKFARIGEVRTIKRKINGAETIITSTIKSVSVDCALRYFLNLYKETHK